ncbi:MAG: lipoyl(octanoyl) transferase LipB [Planctomycetota bacterium]
MPHAAHAATQADRATPGLDVVDLGRAAYADAYEHQVRTQRALIERRGEPAESLGTLFLVEHDPVITVSRRPKAAAHVLAADAQLRAAGVERVETDRGGDVTYHGPGQLVAYPILDLARFGLGLHEYMRLLEGVVIDALAAFGVGGHRDPGVTGVWVRRGDGSSAKIAAMGVRVRKWVTMHGLALNVDPDLSHFQLIVPCGLVGRSVTSLREVLGTGAPGMDDAKREVVAGFERELAERWRS